jgi:hypothetical protein
MQRNLVFRERLLDYAIESLFNEVHLPTFMSSGCYCWQVAAGMVLPISTVRDYDEKDSAFLTTFFARPMANIRALDDIHPGQRCET